MMLKQFAKNNEGTCTCEVKHERGGATSSHGMSAETLFLLVLLLRSDLYNLKASEWRELV